jgi:hypothetical protein
LDISSFIGLANFYRNLVDNFTTIARPLHDAAREKSRFRISAAVEEAWDAMKDAISSDKVVAHWQPHLKTICNTDASDYAVSAVISQKQEDGRVRPIWYWSRKLTPAEINYPVHDKEMLAIHELFVRFPHFMHSPAGPVVIRTDHRSLQFFMTQRLLSRRQARWAETLGEFEFVVQHVAGVDNGSADALSRRPDYQPAEGDPNPNVRTLLPPAVLAASAEASDGQALTTAQSDLIDAIRKIVPDVPEQFLVKWNAVRTKDGLLVRQGRVFIPKALRERVLEARHAAPAMGHPGRTATLANVGELYWWPSWRACHGPVP